MRPLKIRPLSTGCFLEAEKSNFTYGIDQGVKIKAPILMWVIEGGDTPILVDTGAADPVWAKTYHHPIERSENEHPIRALRALGINHEEIQVILNTHLHWDHCFNNDLFPNATILVQEEELRYAISPLPCHALYYESQLLGMTPAWLKVLDRIQTIGGEQEIAHGVRVIPLPSHTPGFQGVLVDLPSGPCMIAGDLCPLFENWNGNAQVRHIPPGIHVNLGDCYESLRKIDSLTTKVLPGHDLKVLEQNAYE